MSISEYVSIRRDHLQALHEAVVRAEDEGLAGHAEPVQAARMVLELPRPVATLASTHSSEIVVAATMGAEHLPGLLAVKANMPLALSKRAHWALNELIAQAEASVHCPALICPDDSESTPTVPVP